jgi:predicted Zn-dependent protease
LGRTV